jgi:transposase-like protein
MALTIQSFMPSEVECSEVLREVRWAGGLRCLHCGSGRVVRRGWRGLYQRYHCKDCGGWFNDRTGTVFAYSKLPLNVWFFTAFQIQSKISVNELAETVNRPYCTMFRIVGRLRRSMYLTASRSLRLRGIVELDEVYVKAGLKGKRSLARRPRVRGLKRRGRGTYASDKPPILGVVERKGLVKLIPLADLAAKTVLRHLFKSFEMKDLEALYTDEHPSYNALRSLSRHDRVNHSLREYARGRVHTNTVEGEFSIFRPWTATFRGISKEHLHLYTAHYGLLRNTRHLDRVQRTLAILNPTAWSQAPCS